jgi:hypothetical protein
MLGTQPGIHGVRYSRRQNQEYYTSNQAEVVHVRRGQPGYPQTNCQARSFLGPGGPVQRANAGEPRDQILLGPSPNRQALRMQLCE